MSNTWLRDLRNKKGYSQAFVADYLNISQSQYGRFETDPDDIPFGKIKALGIILGFDPSEIDKIQYKFPGINIGDPYEKNREYSKVLKQYILPKVEISLESNLFNLCDFNNLESSQLSKFLEEFDQKPTVAIAGKFDTGKTRLANYLLGGEYLPVRRQPATKFLNIIRHISDAPAWLRDRIYKENEQVFLLSQNFWSDNDSLNFNLSYLEDEARFNDTKNCLKSLTLYALHEYGVYVHQPSQRAIFKHIEIPAHTAVIYIDSPFLLSCNLIDTPGVNEQLNLIVDDSRLKPISELMDVLIYMSQLNGFMDTVDQIIIKYFLSMSIKDVHRAKNHPMFGNVFLVCSQASPSIIPKDNELQEVLETGAERLYNPIEESVVSILEQYNDAEYSQAKLAEQFFSFWAESDKRSEKLVKKLSEYLKVTLPKAYLFRLEEKIIQLKKNYDNQYDRVIHYFENLKENLQMATVELKRLEEYELEINREMDRKRSEIKLFINKQKTDGINDFYTRVNKILALDQLEEIINFKYKQHGREEATKNAPLFIFSKLEREAIIISEEGYENSKQLLNEFCETIYNDFNKSFKVTKSVDSISDFSLNNYKLYFPFARSTMLIGYLISSVFGVPGLIIGFNIAMIAWVFNRESWQKRLAKQIKDRFEEEAFVEKVSEKIEIFWNKLEEIFNKALDEFEHDMKKLIKEREKIVKMQNISDINNHIEHLKDLREFFEKIPDSF
ncbi:helix-turn-helix domain-containing protein [Merismopedia glauca]|uniref:HTH cro/C1-type domain-containing protein n=1 Tax=Merismopedia glauca CCAP 1448/3 TaxID=1296344 RepID=A0A2T1C8I8_9CYAN|nr:helix-turn-helix transcriptional regulator [Merismopedia glauca]PSB04453.1 hypothetical protein C7B64_03960 [Merismopedia glauca CCAP 1448/3]